MGECLAVYVVCLYVCAQTYVIKAFSHLALPKQCSISQPLPSQGGDLRCMQLVGYLGLSFDKEAETGQDGPVWLSTQYQTIIYVWIKGGMKAK